MDKVIKAIKEYVTKCVDCKKSKENNCSFLLYDGKIPSPKNNPYLDDEIIKLSHEERVFKLLEKRGEPCDKQENPEQFLRSFDNLLDESKVPEISTELLELIGKIDKVYDIIKRNSDTISFAFGDIVQACIDKCLARIDYYFLGLSIDISCAIKSVSPKYNRSTLKDSYSKDIIDSYVKGAIKLELAYLTSQYRSIIDIANDYSDECATFDSENITPGFRNTNCSAVKEFKTIYENREYQDLIYALLIAFGYSNIVKFDHDFNAIDEFLDFHIDFNLDMHFAIFIRWKELKDEIEASLNRNASDSIQTINYLASIVSATKKISKLFYPPSSSSLEQKEAATLLKLLGTLESDSYKPIVRIWNEAKAEAQKRMQSDCLNEDDYLDILFRIAADKAQEEGTTYTLNEFTIINSLITNLKKLAICITGKLLKAGWPIDYTHIQDKCGIILTRSISNEEILDFFEWTEMDFDYYKNTTKLSKLLPNKEKANDSTRKTDINLIKKRSSQPTSPSIIDDEEVISFNFVRPSGVDEVDKIFKLAINNESIYSDEEFQKDLKVFRKKCKAIANSDDIPENKESWIVSIIDVIIESYYHFSIEQNHEMENKLIQLWAVIESAFLCAPQQICLKNLATELSFDNVLMTKPPVYLGGHQLPDLCPNLSPELALYEEVGPTIKYHQKRICEECSLLDCEFRFENRQKYYEELVKIANKTTDNTRTKAKKSYEKLNNSKVTSLVKHLEKEGYCILKNDSNYYWSKDKDLYAYFCYKLSNVFVGENNQIETKYISTSIISSEFNIPTIGKYARLYREGKKSRPQFASLIDSWINSAYNNQQYSSI